MKIIIAVNQNRMVFSVCVDTSIPFDVNHFRFIPVLVILMCIVHYSAQSMCITLVARSGSWKETPKGQCCNIKSDTLKKIQVSSLIAYFVHFALLVQCLICSRVQYAITNEKSSEWTMWNKRDRKRVEQKNKSGYVSMRATVQKPITKYHVIAIKKSTLLYRSAVLQYAVLPGMHRSFWTMIREKKQQGESICENVQTNTSKSKTERIIMYKTKNLPKGERGKDALTAIQKQLKSRLSL